MIEMAAPVESRETGARRSVDTPAPSGPKPSRPRLIPVEVPAAVVAVLAAIIPVGNSWTPAFPVDDAYISYSYALHLSAGRGLRLSGFGSPVEAFSDPLWVLVLAVGHLLGLAIPTMAMALGLLLIGGLGGSMARLVRVLHPAAPLPFCVFPGLLLALLPATAFSVVAGLETLLFAFLLVTGAGLWLEDAAGGGMRPRTHLCCLLLALTRPEGVVVWAVFVVVTLVRTRAVRPQMRPAAWFVAPMAALECVRVAYFGQLLPNSVVAKSGLSLRASWKLDHFFVMRFWAEYWPLIAVAVVVLAASWIRRDRLPAGPPLSVVVVVCGLFEAAVSSGDGYPYERYLFVLVPLLLSVAGGGAAAAVGTWGSGGRHARPVARRWQPAVAAAAALLALVLGATEATARHHENPLQARDLAVRSATFSHLTAMLRPDRLSAHRGATYQYGLADFLRTMPAGTAIATDEVGVVSYYTRSDVIDVWGLADSHVAHLAGAPGDRADPAYLYGLHPRFLVVLVHGCLCLGVPGDVTYASSPRIQGYRIADLLYDGNAGSSPWQPSSVAAVLFERDPSVGTLQSLDAYLPTPDRVPMLMPGPVEAALDARLPVVPPSGVVAPAPQIAAAGSLALAFFAAVRPAETVSLALPPPSRTGCRLAVSAIVTGGSGATSIQLEGPDGAPLGRSGATLGAPGVQVLSLPLPAAGEGLRIRLATGAGAYLAEPRITCPH